MFNLYKEDLEKVEKPTNIWSKEAKKIERSVSNSFGPYGMYKMTGSGEILSSGKDILDNTELGPMAEPIIESINEQYKEFNDGTTSLALLLSRLVTKADDLSRSGISMPIVISGYKKALEVALDTVKEETEALGTDDYKTLEKVIKHSFAGSVADEENIISTIRDAILFLGEADEENISVLTEQGGKGAEVIKGIKLDYNRIRDGMPDELYEVKIALLDKIAPRKAEFDVKIGITSIDAYKATSEMEKNQLKRFMDKLIELDVKAVFTGGEIDGRVAEMMEKNGIAGFEKINEGDMKAISKATGAQKVSMSTLSEDDLGFTGILDDKQSEECIGGVCRT